MSSSPQYDITPVIPTCFGKNSFVSCNRKGASIDSIFSAIYKILIFKNIISSCSKMFIA
jgi:hypothetical protein